MKWLGALLLIGGGAAVGINKVSMMRKGIAQLDELCIFIRYLQTELCQRALPLPELFRTYESACPLSTDKLCKAAEQGRTLADAVHLQLEQMETSCAWILSELLHVLGKYDRETQAQACGRALSLLAEEKERAEHQLCEKAAIYRTVPLTLGIMAALVLL